jgi:hypothetical protein
VLVGGVSELYQGDLDFGRYVVERLATEELGPGVVVEELHYGAVAVAQRIEELAVSTVVLVGAAVRGRPPGVLERRRHRSADIHLTAAQLQAAVADAVTGYVTIDLVVEVAHALGVLPPDVVAVEVEPVRSESGDQLSTAVAARVDEAVAAVHDVVAAATRASEPDQGLGSSPSGSSSKPR